MLYAVSHTTSYQYTEPVSLCHNLVHLYPRDLPRQSCHQSQLIILPEPQTLQNQTDYFGNPIHLFTIQESHRRLSITARHRVEVTPGAACRLLNSPAWEQVRDDLRAERTPALLDANQFVYDSHFVHRSAELTDYAGASFPPGRPLLDAVMHLTQRIYREFRYDATATSLTTPLHEVLLHRHGVCQDFAHLQIGCLRSLGLASRYVSGYMQTKAPPGRERLIGADAMHAWISVFCPESGWVDYDPTNNLIPAQQHITIAWGRDYADISPVKGIILGGGIHTMNVSVDVAAIA